MTYANYEKELIARLQPVRDKYQVRVQCLPELPSNWSAVAGAGWVTIRWGATSPVIIDVGDFIKEDRVTYLVDIRVQRLREDKEKAETAASLYGVVNETRALLYGFEGKSSTQPIILEEFAFVGTAENYWVVQGQFSTQVWGGTRLNQSDETNLTKINILPNKERDVP